MDILKKFALPAAALFLLTACGSADNEPGPGGVSVGEARALDEAGEMASDTVEAAAEAVSGEPGGYVPTDDERVPGETR